MSHELFRPGRMPPAAPVGLQVAAPLNDQQLLCLMAAEQLAGLPVPDDDAERTRQAGAAVLRSLDILGQVMYRMAVGEVSREAHSAIRAGETDAKARIEAEPGQQAAAGI